MIQDVLPPGAVGAEAYADLDEPLHPEEEAVIEQARPRRQLEFRSVRACARAALAGLDMDRPALVPGVGGMPTWPAGVVGSMTHCEGYRAAAVARTAHVGALGIDAEPDAPLPPGVLHVIASGAEQEDLAALGSRRTGHDWERLLFCAKEAVYKAWFPHERRWLGFEDVRVRIDPGGSFAVEFVDPAAAGLFRDVPLLGRWTGVRGLLVASACDT